MASQAAQSPLDAAQAATAGGRPTASKPSGGASPGGPQGQQPSSPSSQPDLDLSGLDLDRYGDIPYRIEILIGSTSKTIGQVLELETGDTVVLDRQAHEPVVLMIEGRAVAQAEVVSSDKGASIQVTEVGLEE